MAMKWTQHSYSSESGQQPAPPFGAPEGHFTSETNNIMREALASVTELGQAIFGDGQQAAAHTPGAVPHRSSAANFDPRELNQTLVQMIYDVCNPIGIVVPWAGTGGLTAFTAAHVTAYGVTATWAVVAENGEVVAFPDIDEVGDQFTGETIAETTPGVALSIADHTLTVESIAPFTIPYSRPWKYDNLAAQSTGAQATVNKFDGSILIGGDSMSGAPRWSLNTAYAVDDIVNWQGQHWKCISAHTSDAENVFWTASTEPGVGNAYTSRWASEPYTPNTPATTHDTTGSSVDAGGLPARTVLEFYKRTA